MAVHVHIKRRARDSGTFPRGSYVRHKVSGKVGRVVESNEDRTLLRWNAGGTESVENAKLERVPEN